MSWGNTTGVATTPTHFIGLLRGREVTSIDRKTGKITNQVQLPSDIKLAKEINDVIDMTKGKIDLSA